MTSFSGSPLSEAYFWRAKKFKLRTKKNICRVFSIAESQSIKSVPSRKLKKQLSLLLEKEE